MRLAFLSFLALSLFGWSLCLLFGPGVEGGTLALLSFFSSVLTSKLS